MLFGAVIEGALSGIRMILLLCYTFDMNTGSHRLPKAILFDMDGTLLITTQHADQSWQ